MGHHQPDGTMRRWAETAEAVRATRRTSEKVAIVAEYLRSLDDDDLAVAAVFLSGRPFPERDQRRTGLGWAAISAAAQQVARSDAGALGAAYDRSSDLGTAVGDLLAGAGHLPPSTSPPLTLGDAASAYEAIAGARGTDPKRALFSGLLERADPLTARYLTGILAGELRIGLREGHLEAGIAAAFDRDVEAVQWAGMLSGDIGRTAVLAREDALGTAELALFHPLKSMLASPVADEDEALARLPPPVWVEDKYDGIRCSAAPPGSRGPPLQPRPQRRQRAVPRGRRGRGRADLGRHPRRRDPGLAGRRRAALPAAAVAARAQDPVGRHQGAGPGHLRGLRRPRPRAGQACRAAAPPRLCASVARGWSHSASTRPPASAWPRSSTPTMRTS